MDFESEAEAQAFCEQRLAWYEHNVKPTAGTNKIAETFKFIWPVP
jgi:hypothetical protein